MRASVLASIFAIGLTFSMCAAPNTVDYNQGRRGHPVKLSRQVALKEIESLIAWLESDLLQSPQMDIDVVMEVSLTQTESCTFHSTLERELAFAALYANHHLAMAKVVTSLLNVQTPSDFGLAPATATFTRQCLMCSVTWSLSDPGYQVFSIAMSKGVEP